MLLMVSLISSVVPARVSNAAQVATDASCPRQAEQRTIPTLSTTLEKHLSHSEDSLDDLIARPGDLDRIRSAIPEAKRDFAIRRKYQGDGWWQTRDAERRLEDLQAILKRTAEERDHLMEADRLASEVTQLSVADKHQNADDAVVKALRAATLFRTVSGDQKAAYADYLSLIAELYHDLARYKDAESYYVQALDLRRRTLGDSHPQFAKYLFTARDRRIGVAGRRGSAGTRRCL